ncbi:MAG: spore coat protein [bacterium]|nr:spore coat protein [bacterium]
MDSKVCNPKVEVSSGMELNDKDYISSLNTCLKDIVKNYVVAMTEASNERLFEAYKNIFSELLILQRETYELMFRKGWYCLEKSPVQKITQKFDTLSKEYQYILQ